MTDTIAAIATPPGRGGVGIVRLSGPRCRAVAEALLGEVPPARYARFCRFRDAAGEPIDEGLVLFFPAPHSFTGEDVLELQGHGGPVVLDMLLQRVLGLGARMARPGEFSQRAFENDKLDLAQAEAVADLIDSGSVQAARAAVQSLRGEFSRRIDALVGDLIGLRTYIEAAIDFPEEEVDFLTEGGVAGRLQALRARLEALLGSATQGALLREGMRLVLAGQPNAGKSSLLNALAGYESAIVTDLPGTTRDVLREQIDLDGMPLHVIDTAGLRDSADAVEREGVRRAWREIEQADHVLLLAEADKGFGPAEAAILARLPAGLSVTRVLNKIDLTGAEPGLSDTPEGALVQLSATEGSGIPVLREHLKQLMGFHGPEAGSFTARRRHLDALGRAAASLGRGAEVLAARGAGELLAEDLREAQYALGEITGAFTAEDLLGRIFSSFCIGK